MTKQTAANVVEELEGAALGHQSRTKRLRQVVARMARRPGASLPEAMVTSGEIEGLYKFLNTQAIKPEALFEPHARRTFERCQKRGEVLFLHDTTTFTFGGESPRQGVGRVNDGGHGFFGHFCLAVDRRGIPLGVAGLKVHSRLKRKAKKKSKGAKSEDRESLRWGELADEVGSRVGQRFAAIHVMDAEADDYELFAALAQSGERFVIRTAQNRKVSDEHAGRLFEALGRAPVRLRREVHLSERRTKEVRSRSKRNQPRRERSAQLSIRARPVCVRRPAVCTSEVPDELDLNYVHVREVSTPRGEEAVDWVLVTTEPIRTQADVERIVDAYRCRWVIEEYFKALKTGCAFEELQLESLNALLRCLMLKIPIAWQLLLMRSLQWDCPNVPATTFLTADQLTALSAIAETPLRRHLTVLQAVLAIAQLGGHIRANGLPGWMVLGRGMERLREATFVMIRLKNSRKADQS